MSEQSEDMPTSTMVPGNVPPGFTVPGPGNGSPGFSVWEAAGLSPSGEDSKPTGWGRMSRMPIRPASATTNTRKLSANTEKRFLKCHTLPNYLQLSDPDLALGDTSPSLRILHVTIKLVFIDAYRLTNQKTNARNDKGQG